MKGTETTKTFQTRLEDLISETGTSRLDLENGTGISRPALSKYLNDNAEIGINNLVKIANYFNVSPDYLLGYTNAKTNDKNLQFVCDYMGLTKESVSVIRRYTGKELPKFLDKDINDRLKDIALDNELKIELETFLSQFGVSKKYFNELITQELFSNEVDCLGHFSDYNFFLFSYLSLFLESTSNNDVIDFVSAFRENPPSFKLDYFEIIDDLDLKIFQSQKDLSNYLQKKYPIFELSSKHQDLLDFLFDADIITLFDSVRYPRFRNIAVAKATKELIKKINSVKSNLNENDFNTLEKIVETAKRSITNG